MYFYLFRLKNCLLTDLFCKTCDDEHRLFECSGSLYIYIYYEAQIKWGIYLIFPCCCYLLDIYNRYGDTN